jgi:hypothetical protein
MHNRWSEIELCKDARSLNLLCHQDEGPDQWLTNIEVPQLDMHKNNPKSNLVIDFLIWENKIEIKVWC